MALTNAQLEAHLGRMLRTVFPSITTDKQLKALEGAMFFLLPAGKRYVLNGTLGTQAERQEAMTTIRDAVYNKLYGSDPAVDATAAHIALNHWAPGFEVPE